MNVQGSNDDCYFYFYSSCTKGDDCPFRHCQAALGTETVCSLWREGVCLRENCKFRHMESRINRSSIPCYWENQPGGCRKPHCVFLHQKSRSNVKCKAENQGLILPVSTNLTPSNLASKAIDAKDPVKNAVINLPLENYSNHSDDVSMSPHPVEPFVVSFDEGEESDSESVSSTPMKPSSESKYNGTTAKRNLENLTDKTDENNFGIKTLEQIRMEKIHKESEHFYKSDDASDTVIPNKSIRGNSSFHAENIFSYSAYDAPVIDSAQLKKSEISYKPECYPPESEFISVSDRIIDNSSNGDSNLLPEKEKDLRSRLSKRKSPSYVDKKTVPTKKLPSLKNKKEDDPLNFKIKTLDEIRKERENKSGTNQEKMQISEDKGYVNSVSSSNTSNSPASTSNKMLEKSDIPGKSVAKIKIKRMSNEVALNHSILIQVNSEETVQKDDRSETILHEVQNISDDQKDDSNKDLTNTCDGVVTRKRKCFDGDSSMKNGKYIKIESSSVNSNLLPHISNETLNKSLNEDSDVKKPHRPVIRRMSLTPPPSVTLKPTLPSDCPNKSISVSTINDWSPPAKYEATAIDKDNTSSLNTNISPKIEDSLSSAINGNNSEKKTARTTSVDEIEKLLLNDDDINLDDVEGTTIEHESEDLLLEIEQLLDS